MWRDVEDAEVRELCGSAPPHPIRCPVITVEGDRWVGAQEKGVRGVWETGEEGAESGRNRENYTTLQNILQSKKNRDGGQQK